MSSFSPRLTYACELDAYGLQELFQDPKIVRFLQETGSSVSLGILDLSDERAGVVRRLNDAGVPVTAWLLLPKEQGYWFNLNNYPQAAARYEQFRLWSQAHQLHWHRIGLDIEPDLHAMQMLSRNWLAGIQSLLTSIPNQQRFKRGSDAYHRLVEQIHADGYAVETYQFPFIIDERMARSRLLQQFTGLVNLPEVDHEVLMLYSSFMRPWGQAVLWNYGSQARGIGIGSTGGGVDLQGKLDMPPLNWPELQTDLLLAQQLCQEIFVFSLEGCVQQGFLPRLQEMNWQQPVAVPHEKARQAGNVRKVIQRVLWLSARPAWTLFALALMVSLAALWLRKRN